jgi:hypothetical protein
MIKKKELPQIWINREGTVVDKQEITTNFLSTNYSAEKLKSTLSLTRDTHPHLNRLVKMDFSKVFHFWVHSDP